MEPIEDGLDYILSHFLEPWPRTVSTKSTKSRQVVVNSRDEALARFTQADFMDCRISAYPPNVLENPSAVGRFLGIRTVTPMDIIVIIDLDRCNFRTDRGLEMALTKTLDNIRQRLGISCPTVIWSGNGYHIYLVLYSEGIILENIKDFAELNIKSDQISLKFLRFAESFLSNGKSDRAHNTTVSFNNSMMRIPNSYNSKNDSRVRIIQKWDMNTANPAFASIKPLLRDFRHYLIDQTLSERRKQLGFKSNSKSKYSKVSSNYNSSNNSNEIYWIEHLLQTPLSDFRKYCIWRILTPYLLNIRKLSEQKSFSIIAYWLEQCSNLRRLDFNYKQKIHEGFEGAAEGYLPIGHDKLRKENPELYLLLQNS